MKNFFTLLVALVITASTFAQAPEKMSYQAVVRDSGDALVSGQQVGMRISILEGTTPVYVETHTPTTNANGLVSINIGDVNPTAFADIDWSAGTYSIQTEIDPTLTLTNYTITGTSELLSVPFALHATNGQDSGTSAGDMQYWNGSSWDVVAATPNEGAALQMIAGVPTWTGGTPPPTVPDAPTIGTASNGDSQAFVEYTAPLNDGGSPIISYTATSSPGNIIGTLSQSGSGTITITGLTNGTVYAFSVTATNAIGTSVASTISNSVTPNNCVGGSAGPNLVINGDMETGILIDTPADGWGESNAGGGILTPDNSVNNGGSYSAKAIASVSQTVLLKQTEIGKGVIVAGDVIAVSYDLKFAFIPPGGVVNGQIFVESDGGGVNQTEQMPAITANQGWRAETITFTVGNVDVSGGITLQFNVICGADAGCEADANIDNVAVVVVVPCE